MDETRKVLIAGAGHGIGLALCNELLQNFPQVEKVFATYHRRESATGLFNLEKKFSSRLVTFQWNARTDALDKIVSRVENDLDLLMNCIGFLHSPEIAPEKSLKDIDHTSLLTQFSINSCVTPLLAKAFFPLMGGDEKSAVFAALSAKVGSIEDNQIGGWYGYRASKAALNMFIKTLSIEAARSRKKIHCLAIHPGTTRTELSSPFLGGVKHQVWTPEETAKHILDVCAKLAPGESGVFKNWDGQALPW